MPEGDIELLDGGANIDDLAWTDTRLAVLIDRRIVYLGSVGLAETTMLLPENFPWNPLVIAVSGGYLHILGIASDNLAVVTYRAAVP